MRNVPRTPGGIQNNLKIRGGALRGVMSPYPGRVVLLIKYNHFWKFLWLGDSARDILGLLFGSGIFWGLTFAPI